ncbi:MAG: RtcB family protein [Actinobacteria bacterium]|nr:RtcB family protein [Actinomycetota bacterium]
MREIDSEGVPIKVWATEIDDSTMAQARNLANLPFAFRHVAIMPDAHVGYGMPIGGVLAAIDRIIPNAVGLDIGCGVCAWRTGISAEEFLGHRSAILNDVQRSVPQGFHWHRESQRHRTDLFDSIPEIALLSEQAHKIERQAGTLGGGNHFIEFQRDGEDVIWIMVHSGSRNLGKQVAEHYDAIARKINAAEGWKVPKAWELAYLDISSPEGREYLQAMAWCLRFARENRRLIADSVHTVVVRRFPQASFDDVIDVHHNYAAVETHFGREVVVHRKGAVRAVGRVIVPGSMGTASYICRGLANPDSFESCSHGSGRALGRKAAMRAISPESVKAQLKDSDVEFVAAKKGRIAEEAPAAYKDIEEVMNEQSDLVERVVRLLPVGVVKG